MEYEEYLAKYEPEARSCTLCGGSGFYIVKGEEFMCGTCPEPSSPKRTVAQAVRQLWRWIVNRRFTS